MSIAESFWTESTAQFRRLLLNEASGRDSGRVAFEFKTENVTLGFEAAPPPCAMSSASRPAIPCR